MSKSFDELTITDDYMFYKVLQNKSICMRLLNSVLRSKIGRIVDLEYQKVIREDAFAKFTRMDVWITDEKGRVFDVEMQAVSRDNLAKRMRYYQSQVDILTLSSGKDYEDLPDSFIIFFCPFDYPQADLPVYTFRTLCEENSKICLPDGATKIIINSSAAVKEKNPLLQAFMEYMNGKVTDDTFVQDIEQEIAQIKDSEVNRMEYFSWTAKKMDLLREGRREGRVEGRAEGLAEGRKDAIERMTDYLMLHNPSYTKEQALAEATACLTAEDHAIA